MAPFAVTVGIAGIADALHRGGVRLSGYLVAVSRSQYDGAAFRIELERCVDRCDVVGVEPHRAEALGGHHAHFLRHVPGAFTVCGVAHYHSTQFHGAVGGVVKLNPSVEVEGRAEELIYVRGHNLVDDE